MVSLSALISVVVYLVVAGLVFWQLWWLINYIAPPEPFRKIANVVLAVAGILVACSILLSLVGGPNLIFRP